MASGNTDFRSSASPLKNILILPPRVVCGFVYSISFPTGARFGPSNREKSGYRHIVLPSGQSVKVGSDRTGSTRPAFLEQLDRVAEVEHAEVATTTLDGGVVPVSIVWSQLPMAWHS